MYTTLKKIGKQLLPKSLIRKNETFFRKIVSIQYLGNEHQCNICSTGLKKFIPLGKGDLLCPKCGSRSRTRKLFEHVHAEFPLQGNVLHFSPPRSLYEVFKERNDIAYYASDFENEFFADYKYNILDIDTPANFFDCIICYHILEHIEDDTRAMQELKRVLKPSGYCLIQTPFKEGTIYEDAQMDTPEKRLQSFGQEDHVRIYSIMGLKERLEEQGFKVEVVRKRYPKSAFYGMKDDITLVARI